MAKLYFRYAAMNAGKSTQLLQTHHNYLQKGKKVKLLTSQLDDRYGVGKITSRLGVSQDADIYTKMSNMAELITADLDCVLIDEAQFLTKEQVMDVHKLVHTLKVPVICFGIRTDFKGIPFEGASYLLALSEDIEELKTICSCGRKATMNARFDFSGHRLLDGAQVGIEGEACKYESVCADCFYKELDL